MERVAIICLPSWDLKGILALNNSMSQDMMNLYIKHLNIKNLFEKFPY